MDKSIKVCLASDKNYLPHLMATMVSVLLNTDRDVPMDFIILTDGSLDEADLKGLQKLRDFGLKVVNAAELVDRYVAIDSAQTWPLAAYYRLLLPFICRDVDKVLYLDCDIIVRKPIQELWDTPLGNFSIAGVSDAGYPHKERLAEAGIEINGPYFNSGVTLWNIERIHANGYEEKLALAAEKLPVPAFADQCWLNIMFNEDKLILPIRWNVMSQLFSNPKKVTGSYSIEDVEAAMDDPCICHFTNIKPWTMTYTNHPYWFEYWECLKKTPYSGQFWKGLFKKAFMSREDAALLRFVRPLLRQLKGEG